MASNLPPSAGPTPPPSGPGDSSPPLKDGAAAAPPILVPTATMPNVPKVSMPPSASTTTADAIATAPKPPTTQPMPEPVSSPGTHTAAIAAAAVLPGIGPAASPIVAPARNNGASSPAPSASKAPTIPPPIDRPVTAAAAPAPAPSVAAVPPKVYPVVMTADAFPAAAGPTLTGATRGISSKPTATTAYGHVVSTDPMTTTAVGKGQTTATSVTNFQALNPSKQSTMEAAAATQDVEMSHVKLIVATESKVTTANTDDNACVENHDPPAKKMEMVEAPFFIAEKQSEESASTSTKPAQQDAATLVAKTMDPSVEFPSMGLKATSSAPPKPLDIAVAASSSTETGSSLSKPPPSSFRGVYPSLTSTADQGPPPSFPGMVSSVPLGGVSIAGNNGSSGAKRNDATSATEHIYKTNIAKTSTAALDVGGGGAHKPRAPAAAALAPSVASSAKTILPNSSINGTTAALLSPTATSVSASAPPQGNVNAPPTNNNPTVSTASTNNNNNALHPTGRELKVEDALLYLDQVKLEFGDRPRIYNEFLDIMKNFKAQEVDTLGVINRVRRLFHGYNNLILGFNTFLPEGYKIEMRDLEPVFIGPGLTGTNHTPGYTGPGAGGGGGRGMPPGRGGPPHPGGRGMGHPQAFGRGGHSGGGRGMPHPGGRGMPGRGPPLSGPGGRGMQGRGGGPPQLGPGRGMVPPSAGRGGGPMAGGRGGMHPLSQGPGGGGMQPMPLQQQAMIQTQSVQQKQVQMVSQQQQQVLQQGQQQQQMQTMGESNQQNATRTIEFDHAIMYVTNIKKRFANQPRIYHTFLEILHTYQKSQRGIKEVLEQVSSLFADHPDLLREFTFFLPDAVQEQAKERLSRAAAEAEAKQRAAAVEAAAKQQQAQVAQAHQAAALENAKLKSAPTGWRTTAAAAGGSIPKGSRMGQPAGVEPILPSGNQKFIDMTQPDEAGLESPRRASAIIPGGVVTAAQQSTQQDAFVYNAGVERQFFDLVKAALTSFSRDGQAYAEFIKTLDMYAQEILSRNDMLGYVERLLGKRKDLFEEFKRIINAVGSPDAPTHDDSWHSVPLSEIDFSRCRRCSPSYRALPRDYPNPPCSERSDEEVKVLNDVWVSLPLGSEESNNFRHMRKNQYEETLFRCEDMRFEIDMCIDSNAATLQRLTKIYDELRFLSESELSLAKGSIVKKSCVSGAGLGGKIYQYTLDGRVLGVIHKHAIRRIYGDDGNEMLDLCFKNPSVALPIVVNRLRQKNEEFCAAREVLNKKWKDIAENNYYMSLDHRSITWRTTDKRATSTRTIVSEIKDRAAHNGFEGEAATSARMEKAKEEHGIFYEMTMGCAIPRKMDLTGLPLPTKTIFTPHLSLIYDCSSWAQQDAYRIISFALERSSINPGDKERCNRLWRDFIGPWFGLRLSWMHSPATLFTASLEPLEEDEDADSGSLDNGEKESGNDDKDVSSSGGEEDVANDDHVSDAALDNDIVKEEDMRPDATSTMGKGADSGYFSSTNHIPFPPETHVSTSLGEGKIIQYITEDGVYEVSILAQSDSANTAYLQVDAIYGSICPVEPSLLTEQLRANDNEEPERSDDQFIIGTQCLYLFFRLHQILIRRLTIAKKLATDVSNDPALGRHIEKFTFEGDPDEGKKRYEAFLGLVYALIDAGTGSSEASEGGKYEDHVRHLLGNNAYELTTMDKLIAHVLKHLQNMANDDMLQNMTEIYRRHELAGNFKPSAFREEAALMSEGENMYAFQICNIPMTDQKITHFEFLGCIAEDDEDEDDVAQEDEDNKRGINDDMDESEYSARDSKRPKRE